jgi:hypothetical protein
MELVSFLSDHGEKALVGVVGMGRASSAAESAVETLKSTVVRRCLRFQDFFNQVVPQQSCLR